ncbi:MAG: hypothetical protein LBB26_03250 [Puniceicoccales bacterium]|jgi:hypothetical protein|nr:hypothetical protein [Puniceicoccales bacterium]
MKSIITHTEDVFNGDWKLQMFPGLPPGFKLEARLFREPPAFLGRASPLPVTKAI